MSLPPSFSYSPASPNLVGTVVSPGLSQSVSASASEKGATGAAQATQATHGTHGTHASPNEAASLPTVTPPPPKRRSCVTCRSRKVRCDKLSPCANCRRAKIDCVYPSGDRPPRWARRLGRLRQDQPVDQEGAGQTGQDNGSEVSGGGSASGVVQVMDRIRILENLVRDLSGQLQTATASNGTINSGSPQHDSPDYPALDASYHLPPREESPSSTTMRKEFGRLVLHGNESSRYVTGGFWSRVNDEIQELKQGVGAEESDWSEDDELQEKQLSTQELNRTPADRHAFLFRQNLGQGDADLDQFRPLPSQILFLLNVYHENINQLCQVVHMPEIHRIVREWRDRQANKLSPGHEALMFAIYYAAVTSMDDDEVSTNFGASKAELNLRYRLGLELALARADFLLSTDLVVLQAIIIFLYLVRRHDSPRYTWMLTGIAIRMGLALGLQRDPSHFPHLTPYESEMRRRVWWSLLMLDVRSSEDQGMDLTIGPDSFDTVLPLNINECDLTPQTKVMPKERSGVSDMTFCNICCAQVVIVRKLMMPNKGRTPTWDEYRVALEGLTDEFKKRYLEHPNSHSDIKYWVSVTVANLMMAKLSLIVNYPVLFSSPSEQFSADMRTKLFIAAIETAEYNHVLNAEVAARAWRWVYQVYTQWQSIVFLLLEITRRPWTPTVERAWIALHSKWLIPQQTGANKNLHIWLPLRKLTTKVRKHRETELQRLRNDPSAALQALAIERETPQPGSPGPFADPKQLFVRWRTLVGLPDDPSYASGPSRNPASGVSSSSDPAATAQATMPSPNVPSTYPMIEQMFQPEYGPAYDHFQGGSVSSGPAHAASSLDAPGGMPMDPNVAFDPQLVGAGFHAPNDFAAMSQDWSNTQGFGAGFNTPWLWADGTSFAAMGVDVEDVNMSLDPETDANWQEWIASANRMEADPGNGNGGGM